MLFKLVASLFLLTNGVAADKPSGSLKSNEVFPSEQACQEYVETNNEKASGEIAALLSRVAPQSKLDVRFSCVLIEDNTI